MHSSTSDHGSEAREQILIRQLQELDRTISSFLNELAQLSLSPAVARHSYPKLILGCLPAILLDPSFRDGIGRLSAGSPYYSDGHQYRVEGPLPHWTMRMKGYPLSGDVYLEADQVRSPVSQYTEYFDDYDGEISHEIFASLIDLSHRGQLEVVSQQQSEAEQVDGNQRVTLTTHQAWEVLDNAVASIGLTAVSS